MHKPVLNPDDAFHVIGFTERDSLEYSSFQMLHRLDAERAFAMLVYDAKARTVSWRLIEIYQIEADKHPGAENWSSESVKKYVMFEFFNDVAIRICKRLNVFLSPVIESISRKDVPSGATVLMLEPYCGSEANSDD